MSKTILYYCTTLYSRSPGTRIAAEDVSSPAVPGRTRQKTRMFPRRDWIVSCIERRSSSCADDLRSMARRGTAWFSGVRACVCACAGAHIDYPWRRAPCVCVLAFGLAACVRARLTGQPSRSRPLLWRGAIPQPLWHAGPSLPCPRAPWRSRPERGGGGVRGSVGCRVRRWCSSDRSSLSAIVVYED